MINLSEITKQHFNERDVEVPAFLKFLKESASDCQSLLDVGAYYSYATYAKDARAIFTGKLYDACDIRPDSISSEIVDNYFTGNITELQLNSYDLISCISVIEHCGITTYEKQDIAQEQIDVFIRLCSLANKGMYLSFPFGKPGMIVDQYSNISEELLNKFTKIWKGEKGPEAQVSVQFFYNNFAPRGEPWVELDFSAAAQIPIREDLGLVQCVCVFEARC